MLKPQIVLIWIQGQTNIMGLEFLCSIFRGNDASNYRYEPLNNILVLVTYFFNEIINTNTLFIDGQER